MSRLWLAETEMNMTRCKPTDPAVEALLRGIRFRLFVRRHGFNPRRLPRRKERKDRK